MDANMSAGFLVGTTGFLNVTSRTPVIPDVGDKLELLPSVLSPVPNTISVILDILRNALWFIVVTLSGTINVPVMLLHPLNAELLIVVKLSDNRIIPLKPVQPRNALSPMLVTVSGIIRSPLMPVQLSKALLPMLLTPLPISRALILLLPEKADAPMVVPEGLPSIVSLPLIPVQP